MTINYTWNIVALCFDGGQVSGAAWSLAASDGTNSITMTGRSNFTPSQEYPNVTIETAQMWLEHMADYPVYENLLTEKLAVLSGNPIPVVADTNIASPPPPPPI